MATLSELKKRYFFLHRFMCGLTVTCLLITIVGYTIYGHSDRTTQWASCVQVFAYGFCYEINMLTLMASWSIAVVAGLLTIEFCLLKIWATWEDVHHGAVKRKV